MKDNLNHTIVLRTRNRHDWLRRALIQYESFNYTGCLFIIDDSDESIWHSNNKFIVQFKNRLNINHIKGFGASEKTRVGRVLKSTIHAFKEITTKYYSISSDDDFIFPDFISNAIDYLECDNDFSSVIGPEVKLYFDNSGEIISEHRKPWHSCEYSDPLDRILDYAKRPTLAYMGVCRTQMLDDLNKVSIETGRECFSRDGTINFEHYDEELPWVMLVYIHGKIKYLPFFLMGTRGIHESLDRVERMYKINSLKGYSLGPIYALINPTSWQSLINSHNDIFALVKQRGTKYSDDTVSDSVYRVIWHLLRSYNGAGLVTSEVDYFYQYENSKKIKNKIRRYLIRLKNITFSKIAINMKYKNLNLYKKNNKLTNKKNYK